VKNNLVALSIFCFAICFVIGSWLISRGLENGSWHIFSGLQSIELINGTVETVEQPLLTQSDVAGYLGLTIEEVQKLTKIPDGNNSYTTEIPYIEIEGIVYYPKKGIDEWLQNTNIIVVP